MAVALVLNVRTQCHYILFKLWIVSYDFFIGWNCRTLVGALCRIDRAYVKPIYPSIGPTMDGTRMCKQICTQNYEIFVKQSGGSVQIKLGNGWISARWPCVYPLWRGTGNKPSTTEPTCGGCRIKTNNSNLCELVRNQCAFHKRYWFIKYNFVMKWKRIFGVRFLFWAFIYYMFDASRIEGWICILFWIQVIFVWLLVILHVSFEMFND